MSAGMLVLRNGVDHMDQLRVDLTYCELTAE